MFRAEKRFKFSNNLTGGARKFFEKELEGKLFFKKVFPQ